ncbi:hypothetical protein TEQG_06319 [Trichophyton equinum CBS 127.97]|uniref:Uncharacterized protein n=1 Tax=Trichophyton equinum (strain ATCC MYA-4606 / CBS 127.97) TaxID=559882 RepID=F2PZC8_TRIEC|nr:hypothetical protein TEQG_06319 [Trichophyton equinum CBS 127.97]
MADYFRSLALAFQDLKYSPNCVLREYYLAANYRCRAAAGVAKSERTFTALCGGVEKQGFLTDGPNPHRYALDSLPSDPANRFSLKIAGINARGNSFSTFVDVHGEVTVKDINTLVDRIEGIAVDEIVKKPRRLVPSDIMNGRDKRTYT